jgi:L-histidine Nalpha-methyltransferase / hercynylcysteine S-oxide synthase
MFSNLRKVSILLDAFEAAGKDVEYYALDLSLPELQRTFAMVDLNAYKHVILRGLHGTYDDALSWLSRHASGRSDGHTTCVMSLGSSIGNFAPDEATEFLAGYARVLGPADRLLIGVDACQDAERVFRAYNDEKHVTERFYRNALDNANAQLGYPAFRQEDWEVRTAFDEISRKHFANFSPRMDIRTKDFDVQTGETIFLEESWKFPRDVSDRIWRDAGLVQQAVFEQPSGDHRKNISTSRVKIG